MMKRLFNIRIPSFVGILLLLVGVGVTSYLVDQGVILEGRAAPQKEPLNLAITNVAPTSFTVMYTTDDSLPGSLKYKTDGDDPQVALDDRDQQAGSARKSRIHHITVKNLEPETNYSFSILSGDAVFNNKGDPYTVETAPELDEEPSEETPITGSVTFPARIKEKEAIVLIDSETTQPLSAIVNPNGSYTLPSVGIRTKDLSSLAEYSDKDSFELVVFSQEATSAVTLLAKNTHPIPGIMFGLNYDFTISKNPINVGDTASESGQIQFPQNEDSDEEEQVQILSPGIQETFSDQQPVFEGTAIPGEKIEITIRSENPITTTIKADTDGSWEFRPQTPLAPGSHTITIKTRDITGTLREFTRSFTVNAQGSQFVEPSVSPVRTPTPTIGFTTPMPTEPVVPTATPTITPEAPTATPTAVLTSEPSPSRPPIDATGTKEIVTGGIVGFTALLAGFILFFLTKGSAL